ncbi:hypothetical protein GWK47_052546 [Chionoecetes opilio]|uniref:Uncharacterized protein n=1 Tax=Chionoecetes opilio TaxID=41210 RepID=A0A8J4YBM3_CHIOP|nr:hypothetical protein GWK47_052546 [Chionoecetes opilio]
MVPMPRNYQPRNILTTDRTNLEKAFNHRIETGCSIRTACNLFGVKDAFTRSLKESDGRTFVPKHQNIKKVFTDAQEHFIEEYSIKISRMFYGLSTRAFRRMVLKYAEAVGSPAISDVWRRVEMACKAWDKVCNVTNITNGFRATGIFPVNRNIFPDDAFAGAEVTEQAPPDDDDDLPQTLAAPLTPSSLEPDQPQPGPSGIGRMSPAFFASAASTPEAAPQPRQTPTPTASSPPILDVTPEAVQPYPKAPPRPAARGRKKIRACILTEDEEALDQLREKEKKKAAREEKKRRSEEKKREKKREQEARQAAKRRRRSEPVEASSSDEEAADNPALCDDSSEYSDEFAEELEHDAATYPFVQKEPEVGDFVLVQLVFKGKRSEELVHFVAKVISLEEDGRLQLDF